MKIQVRFILTLFFVETINVNAMQSYSSSADLGNTSSVFEELNGKFFCIKNEKFRLPLYKYLIERQKWVSNKISLSPVDESTLFWHNQKLNPFILPELRMKLRNLIEKKTVVELVATSPFNPIYSTEKIFTNQPVFFKWKITQPPHSENSILP